MPGFGSYGPVARSGGAIRRCNGFTLNLGVKKKIGKARKLGKWADGYNGVLNPKYIEHRRKRRQMAAASRSRNRR